MNTDFMGEIILCNGSTVVIKISLCFRVVHFSQMNDWTWPDGKKINALGHFPSTE